MHFPAAVMLFFSFLCWTPRRFGSAARSAIALASVMAFSACIERIQPLVGRDCDLRDFILSTAGGIASVGLYAVVIPARRVFRMLGLATVALMVALVLRPPVSILMDRWQAARTFPILASFATRSEMGRWTGEGCRLSRISRPGVAHAWAMRAEVVEGVSYAGAFLIDAPKDWRGLERLCIATFLPGSNAVPIWVRVNDRQPSSYADRYQCCTVFKPGPNRICIDRNQLVTTPSGRSLDLSHIVGCGLFFDVSVPGQTLIIEDILIETNKTADSVR